MQAAGRDLLPRLICTGDFHAYGDRSGRGALDHTLRTRDALRVNGKKLPP